MEDYKSIIEIIEHYKTKACEVAGKECDKCEAAQEYNSKLYCAFDTVNRFIECANKYHIKKINFEKVKYGEDS